MDCGSWGLGSMVIMVIMIKNIIIRALPASRICYALHRTQGNNNEPSDSSDTPSTQLLSNQQPLHSPTPTRFNPNSRSSVDHAFSIISEILSSKREQVEYLKLQFLLQASKTVPSLEPPIMEILSSKKINKQHSKEILNFVVERKLGARLEAQFLNRYLLHLSQSAQPIDLSLVLSCTLQQVLSQKKSISSLSMRHPDQTIKLFKYLVHNNCINDDELRIFDDCFCSSSYTLSQQVSILQLFGQVGKKGLFVELVKDSLQQSSQQLGNRELVGVLMGLFDLKEIDTITTLEGDIVNRVLNAQLNSKEINFVIQMFHQSGIGSLQFWELARQNNPTTRPNEMFAIAAGYFRNNFFDPQLLLKLIEVDNKIEMLAVSLSEEEFLKVMLVYYANYLRMSHSMQTLLSLLILGRLRDNYSKITYKNNSNLFTWLLTPAEPPGEKHLSFKLCHFLAYEKSLLGLKFPINFQSTQEDKEYMLSAYSEVSEVSVVQQILIRRMKRAKLRLPE